jgi:hypothetical protein
VGDVPANYDDHSHHYRKAKLVKVGLGDIAGAVIHQFCVWGQSAPEGGGYDKCDFKVVWDNGESYDGRFDMQRGGTDGNEAFWASLRGRVSYYACTRRPAHFDDKSWAHHCQMAEKEGWKASAEKMLNECEMG